MSTNMSNDDLLTGKSILIIEDDQLISRVYTKRLIAVGAKVFVAQDGIHGLEILESQKVDVVLLDLGMPGMNGYDTLTKMREKQALQDVPVIVLTNTTESENMEGFDNLKKAGVKHILKKYETSLKEIVQCISSCIQESTESTMN